MKETIEGLRIREFCEVRGWNPEDLFRFSWIAFATSKSLFYTAVYPDLKTLIPVSHALGVSCEETLILANQTPPSIDLSTRQPRRMRKKPTLRGNNIRKLAGMVEIEPLPLSVLSGVHENTVRNAFHNTKGSLTLQTGFAIVSTFQQLRPDLNVKLEDLLDMEIDSEVFSP